MDMEELRLIEADNVKTIYTDGIASALQIGPNVKVVYFEYRMFCGEMVRYPILQMIRPPHSYTAGYISKMLERSRALYPPKLTPH